MTGALLILLAVLVASPAFGAEPVHRDCSACHKDHEKAPLVLKGKVDDLCLGCHAARKGKDHPVGLVSKVEPKGLPLDKEKRLTCVTCHEPHGRGTVKGLLRMEFNALCRSCHTDK